MILPDVETDLSVLEDPTKFQLMLKLSGDMFARIVQYPIIVEQWDKRLNFRAKRLWHSSFTDSERNQITHYYQKKLYRWHLLSGTPRVVICQVTTIRLLKRAVDFFATI